MDVSHFAIRFLSETPFWAFFALAGLLALTVYQYWRTNPPLSPGIRSLLIGLRTVALLALFLTLLEPAVSYDLSGERKPRLALISDVSGSMNAKIDGDSRRGVVETALASSAWKAALDNYDVTEYVFADSVLSAGSESESAEGATALGEALAAIAQAERAEPSDVWLLFSDGISNKGRRPVDVLDELTSPTIAIGVGDPSEGFDIELADVSYNPVAYVGSPSEVKVQLRWRGVTDKSGEALVELREGNQTVDRQRIKLGRGELSADLELTYDPETPGGKFLEARVTPPGAELMTQNNSRVFSLTVLKSRLQVLLVSEALDWDYRFIKDALNSDERVEITEVIEKAPGKYIGQGFPVSADRLAEFDVIVLHNPSRVRSDGRYAALLDVVKKGAGVFVFAGDRYNGEEPSGQSLDGLLPVYATGPARTVTQSATVSLRGENILHPALRISEGVERIRESWGKFPPLEYMAPLTAKRKDAVILAEGTISAVDDIPDLDDLRAGKVSQLPVIAYQKLGRGKALVFNGGPLWRMGFQSIDTRGASERLRAFVSGSVNWLSVSEELAPVRVTPERDVFARGERIGFSGSALDDGYQPLASVEGEVYLYSQDGSDTLVSTLEEIAPGAFRAEFEGVVPGSYRYEGKISSVGKLLKTDTGRVQVTQYSLEERETAPKFSILQTIAESSGGRYAHIGAVGDPSEFLPGKYINVASTIDIPLRGVWPFLAVFIVALALEWIMRKRYQLL